MQLRKISRRNLAISSLLAGVLSGTGDAIAKGVAEHGTTRITAFSDGHFDLPSAAFSGYDSNTIDSSVSSIRVGANVWLLSTPTRQILVDAGSGKSLHEKYPYTGNLPLALAAAGVSPSSITDVIITHMHADHIGGLMAKKVKIYPKARLHVSQKEWAFWTHPDRPTEISSGLQPLAHLIQKLAADLYYEIILHNGESDLGEGIWLYPAVGHTPGHCCVRVEAGNKQVMLLGDAVISDALQFAQPDITYGLDYDPQGAATTRRRLFDMIASDGIEIAATHLNTQAMIGLSRHGNGFKPHLD